MEAKRYLYLEWEKVEISTTHNEEGRLGKFDIHRA